MTISSNSWRWAAITALWILVASVGFVVLVQGMLVFFAPFGSWQMPGAAKVEIKLIERDEQGRITGKVQARQGNRERTLVLTKAECLKIEAEEEVWILDNYFAGGARPDQFLLTPWRLLTEYPEPLLLLALLAIRRLRRAQAKAAKEIPEQPRTVWRDEFHMKAVRFSGTDEAGKSEESDKSLRLNDSAIQISDHKD
ncbi:MAG: hypothetical protein IPP78_11025 [Holophagaceae bacterium]|nr:hypothetical protein [Holophagaceae bacterium]